MDLSLLDWLTEHVEQVLRELGEFIEEEHTAISEREFSRHGHAGSASEDGRRSRTVMRTAKRWSIAHRHRPTGRGMSLGHLQSLGRREVGEDAWKGAGEHRLSGPWRADEKQVMTSRCRHLEGASA